MVLLHVYVMIYLNIMYVIMVVCFSHRKFSVFILSRLAKRANVAIDTNEAVTRSRFLSVKQYKTKINTLFIAKKHQDGCIQNTSAVGDHACILFFYLSFSFACVILSPFYQ